MRDHSQSNIYIFDWFKKQALIQVEIDIDRLIEGWAMWMASTHTKRDTKCVRFEWVCRNGT